VGGKDDLRRVTSDRYGDDASDLSSDSEYESETDGMKLATVEDAEDLGVVKKEGRDGKSSMTINVRI